MICSDPLYTIWYRLNWGSVRVCQDVKKEKDKDKKNELSTSQILGENRSVLFGDNTELTAVLNNLVTLFSRMDSRLSSIEENTEKYKNT